MLYRIQISLEEGANIKIPYILLDELINTLINFFLQNRSEPQKLHKINKACHINNFKESAQKTLK